jgi:hypothetical protein
VSPLVIITTVRYRARTVGVVEHIALADLALDLGQLERQTRADLAQAHGALLALLVAAAAERVGKRHVRFLVVHLAVRCAAGTRTVAQHVLTDVLQLGQVGHLGLDDRLDALR